MPGGRDSRLKDPELYEKLRDEGNSKEQARPVRLFEEEEG